uniref:Uncharacterized protein n=1 Tax=Rhizophora mucronata TaxID=61149 RepID=A0A2P2N7K8_RHIMU
MEEVPAQAISSHSRKFLWMSITNPIFSFNSGDELVYQRVRLHAFSFYFCFKVFY